MNIIRFPPRDGVRREPPSIHVLYIQTEVRTELEEILAQIALVRAALVAPASNGGRSNALAFNQLAAKLAVLTNKPEPLQLNPSAEDTIRVAEAILGFIRAELDGLLGWTSLHDGVPV